MKRSHANAQFAIWIPFVFCVFNIFPEMCSTHHAAAYPASMSLSPARSAFGALVLEYRLASSLFVLPGKCLITKLLGTPGTLPVSIIPSQSQSPSSSVIPGGVLFSGIPSQSQSPSSSVIPGGPSLSGFLGFSVSRFLGFSVSRFLRLLEDKAS